MLIIFVLDNHDMRVIRRLGRLFMISGTCSTVTMLVSRPRALSAVMVM